MPTDYERFEKWAKKRESTKKNWGAELDGQEFMREFRSKFNVGKRLVGVHCPFCTMHQLFHKDGSDDDYLCQACRGEVELKILYRPEKTKVQEALDKAKSEDLEELEDEVLGDD